MRIQAPMAIFDEKYRVVSVESQSLTVRGIVSGEVLVIRTDPEIQSVFALFTEVSSGGGAAQAEHGGSADAGCQNRSHSGDYKAGQGASQTQTATGANHGAEKRPHALAHSIALGVGGRHMVK